MKEFEVPEAGRGCTVHRAIVREKGAVALDGHNPMIMGLAVIRLEIETGLRIWVNWSEPLLLTTSNWSIALLETACPPSFVPLLPAGLAELVAPLAEYRIL